MSQADIREIELSMDEARKIVDRGLMAEKLAANREFKKLVLEGYFVEEASRLALLFSDPNISEEIRKYVERDLFGVGAFKRFLSAVVIMGKNAARELADSAETLEEMRQEELMAGGDSE